MKCGDLVQYLSHTLTGDEECIPLGTITAISKTGVKILWANAHWAAVGSVSNWLPKKNCKILSKIP
jgi:hypothetical protein